MIEEKMYDNGFGLNKFGLPLEILEALSFENSLQKNLRKTTLHKITEKQLFTEIQSLIDFYMECELFDDLDLKENVSYRIKSIDSCKRKYEKYYPNTEINKVFNDILGFRIITEYDNILSLDLSAFEVINMLDGKSGDDGYRGIHLYYKKSNRHFPIEIQINNMHDRLFADWTHIYTYKYIKDKDISLYLRKQYDDGKLKTETDFKEALDNVLSGSEEI